MFKTEVYQLGCLLFLNDPVFSVWFSDARLSEPFSCLQPFNSHFL